MEEKKKGRGALNPRGSGARKKGGLEPGQHGGKSFDRNREKTTTEEEGRGGGKGPEEPPPCSTGNCGRKMSPLGKRKMMKREKGPGAWPTPSPPGVGINPERRKKKRGS